MKEVELLNYPKELLISGVTKLKRITCNNFDVYKDKIYTFNRLYTDQRLYVSESKNPCSIEYFLVLVEENNVDNFPIY